jgi:ligand-binding sensor domain-containing protein/DNA-binding CsgD family transcriptional regulator
MLSMFILIFTFYLPAESIGNDLFFHHLTVSDGLSQNYVTAILQDSRGFMWFGTQDGLNCYDGNRFTIFKADRFVEGSLHYSYISTLFEDRSGFLWIGTMGGGLNRLDLNTHKIEHFVHDSKKSQSLSNDVVLSLCEDTSGTIWVGTADGLNRFNTLNKGFTAFHASADPSRGLGNDHIMVLASDKGGKLWIGTLWGMVCYDTKTNQFAQFRHSVLEARNFLPHITTAILAESDRRIWVGTENGLYLFDPRLETYSLCFSNPSPLTAVSGSFIKALVLDGPGQVLVSTPQGLMRYDLEKNRPSLVSMNPDYRFQNLEHLKPELNCAYRDQIGSLWLGTTKGIAVSHAHQVRFDHFRHDSAASESISHSSVLCFCEDERGTIWLGTRNGLNALDPQSGRIRHYLVSTVLSGENGAIVNGICSDGQGYLWLATENGLKKFDTRTGGLVGLGLSPSPETEHLESSKIFSLYLDPDTGLWVGAIGALGLVDLQQGHVKYWEFDQSDPDGLSGPFIMAIFKDKQDRIWVGTNGGLNRVSQAPGSEGPAKTVDRIKLGKGRDFASGTEAILSICEDAQGILWLGTSAGLDRFDPDTEELKHYSERSGLPNSTVYGILEDGMGKLWLSSNRGLSCFDPQKESFRSYGLAQGVQDLEFNSGAYLKCRDGSLLFGGVNGFNHFDPEKIGRNPLVPPVVITQIRILPRNLLITNPGSMEQSLVLGPDDVLLNIDFAALNFNDPDANRYAYMVEGVHDEWIDLGHQSSMTMTVPSPGHYTFRVKGSNNDGLWNEDGASFALVVKPPFWRSIWFLTLVGLLLLTAAYLLGTGHRRRMAQRVRTENDLKDFAVNLGLSSREIEIILLVLEGRSNKEIEDILFIAPSTVKNHVYSVYRKLNIKNRPQLVAYFRNLKK